MDKAWDPLSVSLRALGRSLQQDFAPVLGPGNDLPPGVSWEDLPALDGVAADWATIATMTDTLSTLYRWLTTDLLGTEASETLGLGNIPLPKTPAPPYQPPAEARTEMDWGHQDEDGAFGIAPISPRVLEVPRSSMAGDDNENRVNHAVADGQPGRTASIPARSPDSARPSSDGGASRLQIIQPAQPQPNAMAPTSSMVRTPIMGGFADLAARLTDSDSPKNDAALRASNDASSAGLGQQTRQAVPTSETFGLSDIPLSQTPSPPGRVQPPYQPPAEARTEMDWGHQDEDGASGIAPISPRVLEVPRSSMAGDDNENRVNHAVADGQPGRTASIPARSPDSARPSSDGGASRLQIIQPAQPQPNAMAPTSSMVRTPIMGGFADLAARLIKIEEHPVGSFQSASHPEPIVMARSAMIPEAEEVPGDENNAPMLPGQLPDVGDLARQTTSALETRSQGAAADWVVSSPPAASLTWPKAPSPDDLDMEDIMDAIAHAITRDYHRFYGP